jgi:hypothetical protein
VDKEFNLHEHIIGSSNGFDVGLAGKIGCIPALIYCSLSMIRSRKLLRNPNELKTLLPYLTDLEISNGIETLKHHGFNFFKEQN